MRRLPIALTMLALAAGLVISPSLTGASPAQRTAPSTSKCGLALGSITAGGDHAVFRVDASNPPVVAKKATPDVYADGSARLSSRWNVVETATGSDRQGTVVLGSGLYNHRYSVTADGALEPGSLTRIGGGWDRFTYFESSTYWYNLTAIRNDQYGLRNDGVLFRWSVGEAGYWRATGSATGFAAVKAMALISKTSSYDMFLANTRDGGLYTVRIPVTSPLKPVFTKIRSTTWQGFESIVAGRCLDDSTVFVGIDKDNKSAYAYVMSHAAGTATTIYGMGQLPHTWADPVYLRWAPESWNDPLFGG
ncbi:hypothetical protein GCM10009789_37060 [Kribbella sancticallisti]|uniref:DUF4185 domain-containing protein n=1 Tax=Kribbella sancticallisti TaxID=460087 RepID=A0ABN2DM87_9ACTN